MQSLRRRLAVILLGLTLFSWLIAVLVTGFNAHYLLRHQLDQQLTEYMDVSMFTYIAILEDEAIASYFEARNPVMALDNNSIRIPGYGSQGQKQAVNLWYQGRHVLVGDDAPRFPDPTGEGFFNAELAAQAVEIPWRVLYRYNPEHDTWMAIGINLERAQSIASTTLWRVLLPLIIILPITISVLYKGIQRGLSPLNALAGKIAARNALDLEPIDLSEVPLEMQGLIHSLNHLMSRLEIVLSSEQRFTANAAHELQTPLTAIKAEVQRCQREVDSESARLMLERISKRVSRATTTVRQLLTLARLDPDQEISFETVDLGQLLLEVVAEYGALCIEKELEIEIEETREPVRVTGNPEWLNIMLQNLVINAINYSSSPGVIEIRLVQDRESVSLVIANDCAPVDSTELETLTQRFVRGSQNAQPGSGLGLSIVQRIVDLHNSSMTLSHRQGDSGFKASIRFPRQA